MFIKFSVKARGISHIESEKEGKLHPRNWPCQDASTAQLGRWKTVGIACVADGHGGNKYFRSDKGSIIAVQIAEKVLLEFYGTIAKEKTAFFDRKVSNEDIKSSNILSSLKQLEANIIYKWRGDVLNDLEQNPLTETEIEFCEANNISLDDDLTNLMFIYGTTLIASLVSDTFWFVIQIGDGLCVVLDESGKIILPIEEDERLEFGRTTSLCDSDAVKNFREAYGFTEIEGLTVATDGVVDSFEPEKYLQFNRDLYDKFNLFPTSAETELDKFLPELSERGSRDDVSIAGIFRRRRGN